MPQAFGGTGGYDAVRNKVIDAMMGRSNIDIGKQEDQLQSDLVARGIVPGSKAANDQEDMLNREKVDARQQAEVAGGNAAQQAEGMDLANQAQMYSQGMGNRQQAVGEQGQQFQQGGQVAQLLAALQGQGYGQSQDARRQAITEMLAQRQTPLNEITALMSGSQVSNPFAMPGYAQNGQVAPAPIFGATQAQGNYNTDLYNAGVGSSNSLTSGLFKLGAAGLPLIFG